MKKIAKILGAIAGIALLAIGCLISYAHFFLPKNIPTRTILTPKDSALVEKGRYLANSVMVCMDCHSQRDWSKFSGPLVPGTLGKGGEIFSSKQGFPGDFSAKNLSPSNLSTWSDGEVLRAMSEGLGKNGNALFPVMPWHNYAQADSADLVAVIAYLRTLSPIENTDIPESKANFPFSIILKTLPKPAIFKPKPLESDSVAYGKYVTTIASCADCHTQQDKGKPIAGKEFAGGFEFQMPTGGKARSANITPDKQTGIGQWTSDQFVARFKHYAYTNNLHKVKQGEKNTPMPWAMYAGMSEKDLRAIYTYLRSLAPISQSVKHFEDKSPQ